MAAEILKCEALKRVYQSPSGQSNVIFDALNLTINEGDFTMLVGPSGCGKSTLLNMIAGFDQPDEGYIFLRGRETNRPGPDKAMVFQDYALLPWLTALDNVAIGLRLKGQGKPASRAKALEYLTLVGLEGHAQQPVYKLSGGMQQRVSIARALALEPKILLMDEPFGALDVFQRGALHAELRELWRKRGITIVFVTHSLEEAIALGTRVLVMQPGQGIAASIDVMPTMSRDPADEQFVMLKRQLVHLINKQNRWSHSFIE